MQSKNLLELTNLDVEMEDLSFKEKNYIIEYE